MSEIQGQTSVVIQAPPDAVYAYLLDFQRHPEWVQNLTRVTQLTPGAIGPGTRFKSEEGPPPVPLHLKLRMMAHFMLGVARGAKTYSEAQITAVEPERRIAWQAAVPKGEGAFSLADWEFVLEPWEAGTRLTQRFRYAPPDPGGRRMIGAAGARELERACAVSLARLRQRLEQAARA